jgi:hypothetical protein
MGGGDKIDIVAAPGLKSQHHIGKIASPYRHSLALMTDLIVLAKGAEEIAVSEENGS